MKVRKVSDRLSPHFTRAEFKCRCRRPECDAKPVDRTFLAKLELLRIEWGGALVPTSGQRCPFYNVRVGGSPRSQHMLGKAADFWLPAADVPTFVALAEKLAFGGIGKGLHLVHIDGRQGKTRWEYD